MKVRAWLAGFSLMLAPTLPEAQSASKPASAAQAVNEYLGRWSGQGRFPKPSKAILTVGATGNLKSCGTLELPDLGCSAPLLECEVLRGSLYVNYRLRTGDG